MLLTRGQSKIYNVCIGNKNVSIPINNNGLIGLYDGIGKTNNNLRSIDIWTDISGNNNNLSASGMSYNDDKSGWIYNSLCVNNGGYMSTEIIEDITEFTYQIGLVVYENDNICLSLPGIDSVMSEGLNLKLKINNTINIIELGTVFTYGMLTNISFIYDGTRLIVYKDKSKIYDKEIPSLSLNKRLILGKNTENIFGTGRFSYVILYNRVITETDLLHNIDYMNKRHRNYHIKDIVLDIRGTESIIEYGKRYIRDVSPFGNNFYIDLFFNSTNSYYKRKSYRFNGYNKIACEGRKLIYDEFTIELSIIGNETQFPNKTFIIGNYSNITHGFRIGLNMLGIIAEFTSEDETKLMTYNINYSNNPIRFSITYKNNLLVLYVNGIKVKEEAIKFKNFYKDFMLYLGSQGKEWDGYSGLMNSCRIYKKALTEDIIKNNVELDKQLYD